MKQEEKPEKRIDVVTKPVSILKVVISIGILLIIAVTVPCFKPVSMVLLKIEIISSGRAFVVISKSLGLIPRRLSLT